MVVTTGNAFAKASSKSKSFKQDRPPLKELLAKKYPFSNSDLSCILDDLLEKDIIQLPEAKRPEEIHNTDNPKYCRYHRMISHNIEDCITLKELIMKLVGEGRIMLDDVEMVEANNITMTSFNDPLHKPHKMQGHMIQFGCLPPIEGRIHRSRTFLERTIHNQHALPHNNHDVSDEEGWIVMTPKKSRKQLRLQPQTIHHQSKHWGRNTSNRFKEKKNPKSLQKSHAMSLDHSKQDSQPLATLKDFFPKGYFAKVNTSSLQTPQESAKPSNAQAHPFKKIRYLPNAAGAVMLDDFNK